MEKSIVEYEIDDSKRQILQDLAQDAGCTLNDILDEAVTIYIAESCKV